MTTQKCLIYQSESRLACGNCLPATVILCIAPQIVANQTCPDQETDQPFTYSFIEGSVTSQSKIQGTCGSALWKYTICYDESQIIEGQTLCAADITGIFCKGCLAQWVEDLVGGEVYLTINDEETEATLHTQHGCEYDFPLGGGAWWPGDSYFGDGSDGDRVVDDGQEHLVECRNYYFDNLTIAVGGDLNPVGAECCPGD